MRKVKFRSSLSGKEYSRDELLGFFSAFATVSAIQNPAKALEDKIKRKSWFEGVILAAALLESIGMAKLKTYYKKRAVDDLQTVDRLNCGKIAVYLFGVGLVDQPTYSKMILIDRQREELVKKIRDQYKLKPEEAEKIIRKAIECLEALNQKGSTP
jgi:hypothetical protein